MCVCVCFRVKGCVTVSVDRCKAPLIGWSPLVTPQAANVQMVHCRGGDSIRCWKKLWDSSDMRLSLQDTSESNHSRMWMRPACIMHRFVSVSSLSFFFFFFFFYINYFCAVGAEGCDSTSNSKGSCRCSEQLDGHSAPSQRVGFFSPHDVGDIVQTIQNNRGLFVEHDTWLVNVRAAFMIVPLDEFHIISDAGNSRCVIFLFQVHYIDITWGILHQIIQE